MPRFALILASAAAFLAAGSVAQAGAPTAMKPPIPAHAVIVDSTAPHLITPASHQMRRHAVRLGPRRHAAGCWQTYNPVYGLYAVAFCLGADGAGSYRVKGGGYDCRGGGSWRHHGQAVVYQMQRGTCGHAADWTADQIVCVDAAGPNANLSCTYTPAGRAQPATGFAAFRQ